MWSTTNLLKNTYVDNDNYIDSKYSLKVNGKSGLVGGLDVSGPTEFYTVPSYVGGSVTFTGPNFITKAYADSTYTGGGATGACLLNANNIFTTASGDILRSNGNPDKYFYLSSGGEIGVPDLSAGTQYNWKIQQNGYAYFRSNQNSFKHYAIEGDVFRYYNLGGTNSVYLEGGNGKLTLNQILLNGNNGISTTNSTGVTIDFKQNAPIMRGNNIVAGSVPDTALTSNIVKKNAQNTFISTSGTTENLIQVNKTIGTNPNGFYYVDNYAAVGYYDISGSTHRWNIDSSGNASFNGAFDVSGAVTFAKLPVYMGSPSVTVNSNNLITKAYADANYHPTANTYVTTNTAQTITGKKTFTGGIVANCDVSCNGGLDVSGNAIFKRADINNELNMNADSTFTIASGATMTNAGTIYNDSLITITASGEIPASCSGSKINISSVDPITLTLPSVNDNYGVYYWISNGDVNPTTIYAASGEEIYNGSTSPAASLTLELKETIFIQIANLTSPAWIYNTLTSASRILNSENTWTNKNTFISSSGTTENLLRVNKTIGTNPNGFFYVDNYAAVGYYDDTTSLRKWNIDSNGNADFSGNVYISDASINKTLTLTSGSTTTNNGIFTNAGTMKNEKFRTITATGSLTAFYSGSKINISVSSPITVSLPNVAGNSGVYYWITGDDSLTTTIQVASGSGNTIFNGSTSVGSFILNANQTIFIQVCIVGGADTWVYNLFDDGSNLLDYNNVWTGTNAFNTSLPTSTVTPTTSTQLITKGYADGQYVTVTGDQNITTGQKRFYKAPMLGCESATGVLTKIGYNTGTYLTDATKLVTAIGANVLKNNTAGMPLLSLCVAIGNNALENFSPTTAKEQLTAVGTYALRALVTDSANTAVGTYAGLGMQYGTNNAFFGNGCGLGLVGSTTNPCNRNFLMGGQVMSGDGRAPIGQTVFTGATQTSDTIVFASTIAGIYAGAQIYFYTAASGGGTSAQNLITSWDTASYTVVMNATSTIIQNSLVFIWTTGSQVDTNVYPGATATGTTFTLQNNSTLIAAGNRCVYFESATLQKYVSVTSWNNTTKVLVLASSITLYGGSTLVFRNTATTTQDRGNGYNDNCCVGNFALANAATGCSRNVAIGSAALNAVSPPTGYNGTTFIWGTDNIAIGYAAAAYARHGTNRCIFIGSNCQQNGSALSPYRQLTEACAFGYLTNTWADYMYVFGGFNNFIYYPTNYKVCFGVTPTINSSRTDYAETGARGVLQIVCGSQDVAQNAISCKAYNDAFYIINFQNSAGVARGQIAGVNSTSVAYNTSSDERIKDEIEDMPSQLENIQKVKARKFKWKESREEDNGFIAQEFYSVYPERNPIKNNDSYEDKLYPEDCILGMDYGRCTPYLWKGVSELIDIVKKQQEEINSLKEILSRNNIQ